MLTIVSSLFNFPGTSYAAWDYSKTWTTKSDFETGTTLTNVAVAGDNDENDANNNDGISLTSQAEKRQTIAAGYNQSVILKSDGTVWGTGYNFEGNLGTNNQDSYNSWVSLPISDVVSVYNKGYASMVIRSDGSVWATGYNPYGNLGVGDAVRKLTWTRCKENASTYLSNVKKIVPHLYHSIALKEDGTVWVAGYSYYGQLGFGDTINKYYWTQVTALGSDNVDIAAGERDSLVVKTSGDIFVTGWNGYGQLGLDDTTQRNGWVQSSIPGLQPTEVAVSAEIGQYNSFILTNFGNVFAAGYAVTGRLAVGDTLSRSVWTPTVGASNIKQIAIGVNTVYAIDDSGKVYGSGENLYGQLNVGDFTQRAGWTETRYQNIREISAGSNFALLLQNNGSLIGVGYNGYGQLGVGDTMYRSEPAQTNFTAPSYLDSGYFGSYSIKNGNLWSVGMGWDGRNGFADGFHRNTWSQTPQTNVAKVKGGGSHAIILKNDGTVWGVGINSSGQLGVGDFAYSKTVFTQAKINSTTFLTNVVDIDAGGNHSLALTSNGDVYATGLNNYCQLGIAGCSFNGANKEYWTLVNTSVASISAGDSFSYVLKNDETKSVWGVGYNGYGQLGLGNTTNQAAWVQISTGVTTIEAGPTHAFVIKNTPTTGTLYGCGWNSYGSLGLGDTSTRTVWTQTALNGVNSLSTGYGSSFALKNDGTLMVTGFNGYGQLGLGNFGIRNSWTQSPLTGVSSVSAGYYHTAVIKDGYVWSFGWDGNIGSLGLGTPWYKTQEEIITGVKQYSPYLSSGSVLGLRLNALETVKWVNLLWDGTAPAGTVIKIRARGAAIEGGLSSANWSEYITSSGSNLTTPNSQWLELEVVFESADGTFTPTVNSLTVTYYSDILQPTNPTTYSAWSDNTKTTEYLNDTWHNDNSVYFEWNAAVDVGESGIKGYWVYFGNDQTADPLTAGTWQIGTSKEVNIPDIDTGKTFYLCISAEDNAGNRYINTAEPFYKVLTYKFDKTAPEITTANIIVAPVGWSTVNNFNFSWQEVTDPDTNGDKSGIRGYIYKRKNGIDNWSVETADRSVTGVEAYQNGQNIFEIKAIDNAGNESAVKETNYFYNADAPTLPLALSVTPQSSVDNNFDFSWEAPASANGGVKGYYYSVNAIPSKYNTIYTTATTTGEIHAATQQSFNTFYVVAMDSSDNINWGNYASVQFECNTPAPGTPTTPEIFDTSNRDLQKYSIALSWNEPVNKGAGFSGYIIERSTDGETFTTIGTSGGTSYLDAGLESITYYYRMISRDNSGNTSAPSTVVSLLPTGKYTTPPTITVDPEVTVKVSTAEIRWVTDRISSSFVEIGEDINYGLTQGQFEFVSDHKVKIERLKPDTIYHFRVKFVDIDGNIGYSNDLTLRTEPAPRVERVSIQDVRLYTAVLTWYTSEPAVTNLLYGKNTGYGSEIKNVSGGATTVHSVRLDGLDHSSVYHFAVKVRDIDNNEVLSDDYSFETQKFPTISLVRMESVRDRASATMRITWKTNVPTSSIVEYTPIGGSKQEAVKTKLETDHEILVTGLFDNTYYYIVAKSADQFGNIAVSDSQRYRTDYDTRPPVVSGLSFETSNSGYGVDAKTQIVVYWETDEPATSQIEYGVGLEGEYSSKSMEDATLGTSHVVVVSDLKSSTAYHFRAVSRDGSKNMGISEEGTVLTEQAKSSIIDLVFSTLQNALGWLFGK